MHCVACCLIVLVCSWCTQAVAVEILAMLMKEQALDALDVLQDADRCVCILLSYLVLSYWLAVFLSLLQAMTKQC